MSRVAEKSKMAPKMADLYSEIHILAQYVTAIAHCIANWGNYR